MRSCGSTRYPYGAASACSSIRASLGHSTRDRTGSDWASLSCHYNVKANMILSQWIISLWRAFISFRVTRRATQFLSMRGYPVSHITSSFAPTCVAVASIRSEDYYLYARWTADAGRVCCCCDLERPPRRRRALKRRRCHRRREESS